MKKLILSGLAVGVVCALAAPVAQAGQTDDVAVRLAALEKENAAIRKENAALLENKQLRERNATLKSSAPRDQPQQASVSPVPVITQSDFDAYAALPVRREPLETRGQFRFWGEGGAFWSGGDSNILSHDLIDFRTTTLLGSGVGFGGGLIPGFVDLKPKAGWEGAAGFDYRFANSPWHINGQFRYGQSGKGGGTLSASGSLDPAIIALLNNGPPPAGFSSSGNESFAASHDESHWLADLAVGRDVIGSGPEAMQVKFGVRIAELTGTTNTQQNIHSLINFGQPVDIFGNGFPPIDSLGLDAVTGTQIRDSYFGAGPRIGVEGSVPIAGNWAFDYLGDAAVLFGKQSQTTTSISTLSATPAVLGLLLGGGGSGSFSTAERYSTVFNADIQVGVSYWLTHHVKLSASYRFDAFVNATQDATGTLPTVNRYIHGPHLGVSGTF